MSIPYYSARSYTLPYREVGHLPNRPRYAGLSPSPNFIPRDLTLISRSTQTSTLTGGFIALIVILVIAVVAGMAILGMSLYKRKSRSTSNIVYTPFQTQENPSRPSWQRLSSRLSEKSFAAGSGRRSASAHSRMPSITISKPILQDGHTGPTPVFDSRTHSRRNTAQSNFTDSDQSSPEAVYDPYSRSRSQSRSRSRTRSNFSEDNTDEAPRARTLSPNVHESRSRAASPTVHPNRSRNASPSSLESRSHSLTRYSPPTLQKSWSSANISARYMQTPSLSETSEDYDTTPSSSAKSSPRDKVLPPTPLYTPPKKSSLLYTPADPNDWRIDPYTKHSQPRPAITISDAEGLQVDDSQIIEIAIAGPLDIPTGPLTPFGEREAKAGAAQGMQSSWYKSPRNEGPSWLV